MATRQMGRVRSNPSSTERGFLQRVLRELQRMGYAIVAAGDEEDTVRTASEKEAIEHVMSMEHGAIRLKHPLHGAVVLSCLFQGGAPEEVVYDYRAREGEAREAVEHALTVAGIPLAQHELAQAEMKRLDRVIAERRPQGNPRGVPRWKMFPTGSRVVVSEWGGTLARKRGVVVTPQRRLNFRGVPQTDHGGDYHPYDANKVRIVRFEDGRTGTVGLEHLQPDTSPRANPHGGSVIAQWTSPDGKLVELRRGAFGTGLYALSGPGFSGHLSAGTDEAAIVLAQRLADGGFEGRMKTPVTRGQVGRANPPMRVRDLSDRSWDWIRALSFFQRYRRGNEAKLSNNTVVRTRSTGVEGSDDVEIVLHATPIVTFHADGTMTLNSGGYHTATTKARINSLLPPAVHLVQKKGKWLLRSGGDSVPFFDGMRFGVQTFPHGAASHDVGTPRLV